MQEAIIDISTIERVKEFVHICEQSNCDINVSKGSYVVDGKSILGVLSLDVSKGVTIEVFGTEKDKTALLTKLDKFIES